MKFSAITALICAGTMMFSSNCIVTSAESDMRDMTTMEIVRDMGVGINLGNTFESCGDWIAQWGDGTPKSYETAWGSPEITQEMIQGYADEGFGVIRIPVAWSNMMGENYTISSEYLARVKQVVDWSLDTGMYVILNIHYDNGWWSDFPTKKDECMKKYTRVWEQLTDAFGDYDDKLMFESLNEEGGWDSVWNQWTGTEDQKKQSYALLNEINQKFVDIVRSSGKNNAERHLLIAGYKTDVALTCDPLFEMPEDSAGRCAVSVHYYTPSSFAILEEDADWAKMRSTWGTDEDFKELDNNMTMLKTTFIDNGIPVIIGEYGCPKKNKDADSVRLFLSSVCETAYENQLCPVLWDISELHYDRNNCKMYDEELKNSIMSVVETKTIKGDINSDGQFNIADAVKFNNYLISNESLTNEQIKIADLNEDGVADVFDLVLFRQMVINVAYHAKYKIYHAKYKKITLKNYIM